MIPKLIKINLNRPDHATACNTSQPFAKLEVRLNGKVFKASLSVIYRPEATAPEVLVFNTRGTCRATTLKGQPDDKAKPKKDDRLRCGCGRLATCMGAYEGAKMKTPACDTCCAHGCEDGKCTPIKKKRPAFGVIDHVEKWTNMFGTKHGRFGFYGGHMHVSADGETWKPITRAMYRKWRGRS